MYFGKFSIILLIASCVIINAQMRRKISKTKSKIKKSSLPSLGLSGCGCQSPLLDILNCGCRGPVIEPVYAPVAIPSPGPVIDVPNYRYADPLELNPLGCLFPSSEVSSFGVLPSPISVPSIEVLAPLIDLPCGCSGTCGCPGPKCGCRAPVVKLPANPCGSLTCIDVPKCGCQSLQLPTYSYGISSVIELPSYGPVPSCGCQGPCGCAELPMSSCGCSGPCGCAGIPLSSCDCLGPCSCAAMPISSCGCNGPCGCAEISIASCGCAGIPISSCGCNGPCGCAGIPISSCGCSEPCGYSVMPISSCGCPGPCGCAGIPVSLMPISSCGCPGPCGCAGIPVSSCGCLGPCGCLSIQMPSYGSQLPGIEVPSCGCGVSRCGCNPKHLRQITLQPPCL